MEDGERPRASAGGDEIEAADVPFLAAMAALNLAMGGARRSRDPGAEERLSAMHEALFARLSPATVSQLLRHAGEALGKARHQHAYEYLERLYGDGERERRG
jgi:phage gp29-like protein